MASSSDKPLIERLRERKLVQWALGYLAGGLVVLQLIDGLSEPLAFSHLVQQGVPGAGPARPRVLLEELGIAR